MPTLNDIISNLKEIWPLVIQKPWEFLAIGLFIFLIGGCCGNKMKQKNKFTQDKPTNRAAEKKQLRKDETPLDKIDLEKDAIDLLAIFETSFNDPNGKAWMNDGENFIDPLSIADHIDGLSRSKCLLLAAKLYDLDLIIKNHHGVSAVTQRGREFLFLKQHIK